MGKRVADLLIETLQAAGVKTCYGIVGDTMNRIAHAIDRSEIEDVATIQRFVRERCKIHPAEIVAKSALYKGYCSWCETRGVAPLNKNWFGRELRAAPVPHRQFRAPGKPGPGGPGPGPE